MPKKPKENELNAVMIELTERIFLYGMNVSQGEDIHSNPIGIFVDIEGESEDTLYTVDEFIERENKNGAAPTDKGAD